VGKGFGPNDTSCNHDEHAASWTTGQEGNNTVTRCICGTDMISTDND
jgi:hypothetical protein